VHVVRGGHEKRPAGRRSDGPFKEAVFGLVRLSRLGAVILPEVAGPARVGLIHAARAELIA